MDDSAHGEDSGRPGTGPLETILPVDGDGSRIAQARHLVAAFLNRVRDEYGIAVAQHAVEIAQLVASELVTNARKYAPGPALLRLRLVGSMVRVEVWDSDPALPAARAAEPGRVGQHGLEIVTALAQAVDVRSESAGKVVTADIALSGGADGVG
ncbi:ATP-binding protein [Streptomyces sp. NPDC094038]|uniref:ATP-binding protein n=1 Tax=Streptomyces sp. NPDC094038 TaxID=3366055 RepID=UPI00380E57BF